MKYTILKNWHYSIFNPFKHKWIRLDCQEVRFKFTIPKEAWTPKENEDDSNWNKLYGIAYGFGGTGVHTEGTYKGRKVIHSLPCAARQDPRRQEADDGCPGSGFLVHRTE